MKTKSIMLTILMLLVGVMMAGGTYAFLTIQANVTNANYVGTTKCFLVDYNINNSDNTQDITGTLFPSIGPSSGLNGRVGLKTSSSCDVNGIGTLKLSVASTTASHLTEIATSHCEDKKTGDILTTYATQAACSSANQNWKEYPTSYCESNSTLQTLKEYTTSSACTSNNGIWITSASDKSPLKYAIYNNSDMTGDPIKVGKIKSSDLGNDIVLSDDIILLPEQRYFYVYIWLDGYLTDNTYTELSFNGYIKASAIQSDTLLPSIYRQVEYIENSGVQYIDTEYYWQHENIEIYYDGVVVENPNNQSLFGNEEYVTSSGTSRNFSGIPHGKNGNFSIYLGTGGMGTVSLPIGTRHNLNIVTTINKNLSVYKDGAIAFNTTYNGSVMTRKNNYYNSYNSTTVGNLFIFSNHNTTRGANNNAIQYISKMQLYLFKMYDNDSIVRYFVPCYLIDGGTVGLYDIINNRFYINKGAGSFIAGADI